MRGRAHWGRPTGTTLMTFLICICSPDRKPDVTRGNVPQREVVYTANILHGFFKVLLDADSSSNPCGPGSVRFLVCWNSEAVPSFCGAAAIKKAH